MLAHEHRKNLRVLRDLMNEMRDIMSKVNQLLVLWDEEDQVYLPSERQLDVRIDGRTERLAAAPGETPGEPAWDVQAMHRYLAAARSAAGGKADG